MKIFKKKICIILTILIILSLQNSVFAYFTNSGESKINMKLGSVKLELTDEIEKVDGYKLGDSINETIKVKNIGNINCFVRIKVGISNEKFANSIQANFDNQNFFYNSNDGYWYYTKIVIPNGETENLLSSIKILEDGDSSILEGFNTYTFAEVVQISKNEKGESDLAKSWGISEPSKKENNKLEVLKNIKTEKAAEEYFVNNKYKNKGRLTDYKFESHELKSSVEADISITAKNNFLSVGTEITPSDFNYIVKYEDGRILEKELSEEVTINNEKSYKQTTPGEYKVKVKATLGKKDFEKEISLTYVQSDYFIYHNLDTAKKTIEISGINPEYDIPENLNIPSTFNGYKIVKIADLSFANLEIKNVEINADLDSIENYAFKNTKIEKLTIKSKITKVLEGAFEGALIDKIEFYGTEDEFKAIQIESKNEALKDATIDYKN